MFPLQEAEAGICYANAGISRAEGASASAQLQIPEVNPKDGKATGSEPELEAQPLGLPALDATSSESDCELEPQKQTQVVVSLISCEGPGGPTHSRVLPLQDMSDILQDMTKRSFARQPAPGVYVLTCMADLADFATIHAPADPRYSLISIAWHLSWAPGSEILARGQDEWVGVSKSGQRNLTLESPSWLHVYQASSGQLLHSLALQQPLQGSYMGRFKAETAWSPDARQFAFCGRHASQRVRPAQISMLDVESGAVLGWRGNIASGRHCASCHTIMWAANSQ